MFRASPCRSELYVFVLCVLQFVVASQHVDYLVHIQFFHAVACGGEVFARVELGGFLGKGFAYGVLDMAGMKRQVLSWGKEGGDRNGE